MSYIVSTEDLGSITLNEKNTVKSVLQNIKIILLTHQFSIPLYRNFGLSMQFANMPVNIAKPLLITEIVDAITEYEPRATVLSVDIDMNKNWPDKIIAKVEVDIEDE